MSDPTKEQLEEAVPLLLGHAWECPDGMVMSAVGLAHIIAKVRTKATNDALERAAMRFTETKRWAVGPGEISDEIRAMKVPT